MGKKDLTETAYLSEEQIRMFRSDFKVVAEFFVKRRKDKGYIPESKVELNHIQEVLNLLSAVTKDERYKQVYEVSERKVNNMCEVADRLHQQGAQTKAIEIAKSLLDVLDITTIAEKTGLPLEVVERLKKG